MNLKLVEEIRGHRRVFPIYHLDIESRITTPEKVQDVAQAAWNDMNRLAAVFCYSYCDPYHKLEGEDSRKVVFVSSDKATSLDHAINGVSADHSVKLLQKQFSTFDTDPDEEIVLVQVVEIDRSFAVAGVGGYLLDRRAPITLLEEKPTGGIQEFLPTALLSVLSSFCLSCPSFHDVTISPLLSSAAPCERW